MAGKTGDLAGKTGDLAGKTGDLAGKTGDLSGKTGDLAGKTGDLAGKTGDLILSKGTTALQELRALETALDTKGAFPNAKLQSQVEKARHGLETLLADCERLVAAVRQGSQPTPSIGVEGYAGIHIHLHLHQTP